MAAGAQAVAPELPPMPFELGDVVDGKYRVDRVVGVGGMAIVFAATHVNLHQEVAIKVLLAEQAANPVAVERFVTEARAAVRLKSTHVARVLDVGMATNRMGEMLPFMVMELLEGRDLESVLAQRGPLGVEEAVQYVIQACDAVGEAHSLGIIHRDLKPANLFLSATRDGTALVKVLDFGISKVARGATVSSGPDGARITQSGEIMGSPQYMSPEQTRGTANADARSDVWSLGVVLYELLTGQEPFHAPNIPDTMVRVLTEDPLPVNAVRPDIPAELSSVVMRCLQKDPGYRFGSIAELAGALAPFTTRGAVSVPREWDTMKIQRMQLPPSAFEPQSSPRPSKRHDPTRVLASGPAGRARRAIIVGSASAALVGIALIAFALHSRREARSADHATAASSATVAAASDPPTASIASTDEPRPVTTAAAAPPSPAADRSAAPAGPAKPRSGTRAHGVGAKPTSTALPKERTNW